MTTVFREMKYLLNDEPRSGSGTATKQKPRTVRTLSPGTVTFAAPETKDVPNAITLFIFSGTPFAVSQFLRSSTTCSTNQVREVAEGA